MRKCSRVCESRKLLVNLDMNKVMKCSRRVNVGLMYVRLNIQLLEEVDWFKYLGSQVAADGGCGRDVVHIMGDWYNSGEHSTLRCAMEQRV